MNRMVAAIISAMVKDKRFKDAIKAKIGTAVDTSEMEERIEALCTQLKPVQGMEIKSLPLESESTVETVISLSKTFAGAFSGV